ncbi:MAG: 23S rRNA (uridine2552-2'-O)-methyltransferase [Patiriisocius sp.]|jgi:23S rRNA (uridine2552-2'-O)-methyltransferase
MKKSKSSHQWLKEHEDDEFVKRARAEGYRSRAAYKLLEIKEKYGILKSGQCVVDLGAAPGSWSQVALKSVGDRGRVIALDILPMGEISEVTFIQGDFTEAGPFEALLAEISEMPVDLVISDMAPNLSGMKQVDQPAAAYLVELAIDLAEQVLKPGGSLICKCFEGDSIDGIRSAFRAKFMKVTNFKPKASRNRSPEIFVIGQGYRKPA